MLKSPLQQRSLEFQTGTAGMLKTESGTQFIISVKFNPDPTKIIKAHAILG
jgi:hypothetical protein